MQSKHTAGLEADFSAKGNAVNELIKKNADLELRYLSEKDFGKKAALREERLNTIAELRRAKAAVLEAEPLVAAAHWHDELDAKEAALKNVNAQLSERVPEAIEAAKTAVRKLSEVGALARSGHGLALELGGPAFGYSLHPSAFMGIDRLFFERLAFGADISRFDEVRFPTIVVSVDAPSTRGREGRGGLIDEAEITRLRAAHAERAARNEVQKPAGVAKAAVSAVLAAGASLLGLVAQK